MSDWEPCSLEMDMYLLKYNLSSGLRLITAHWMVSGAGSKQALLEQDDCIVPFAMSVPIMLC